MEKVHTLYARGVRDFPTLCDKLGKVDDLFEFNRLAEEGYTLTEIKRYFSWGENYYFDTLLRTQYIRITEGEDESKIL